MTDTVETVVKSALASLGSNDGVIHATTWVKERLEELYAQAKFRSLRRQAALIVPASISTGTVTVTQGSNTVVGDTDARAAWLNQPLAGRYFRQGVAWYQIQGFAGQDLQLTTTFAEATGAATGYTIVQRQVVMPLNFRRVESIECDRYRTPLGPMPLAELNARIPERLYGEGGAFLYADLGDGTFELYPYSNQDELYHVLYWVGPPAIDLDTPLPPFIDAYVLKEGILVNAMDWKASQAADGGKADIAAFWMNRADRQRTRWAKAVAEAIREDRATEDLTLFVAEGRSLFQNRGDLKTAYDEWVARGGALSF